MKSLIVSFSAVGFLLGLGTVLCLPRRVAPLTLNATHFAKVLAGDGMTIVDAQLTLTHRNQAGLFTKPSLRNGIGLTSGVVLSSAWASEENGTNDNTYLPGRDDLGGIGYDAFDEMLHSGFVSGDACVLRIEFGCPTWRPMVSLTFVFGTDDYPWVGTSSDNWDMAGLFLADDNFALLHGRELTTTRKALAPYKDNRFRWYQTEMNGFTKPITASAVSFKWWNVLYVVVADTGRASGTSIRKNGAWLFLKAGSLTCNTLQPSSDRLWHDDRNYFDDYFHDDDIVPVTDVPTSSPFPTITPPKHPSQLTTPPGASPTPRPTAFPVTSVQYCASIVHSMCPKCGDWKCYSLRVSTECNFKYGIADYSRKVKRIILRNYCP